MDEFDDIQPLDDIKLLIRLSAITKGELLKRRRDVRKSLVLTAISEFDKGIDFKTEDVSKRIFEISKCLIKDEEIISILDDFVDEGVVEHLENINYKLIKQITLPQFEQLTQPVWEEFQDYLHTQDPDYDPHIHKNAKNVFESILVKILSRFSLSKPLENQMDSLPIEDIRIIIQYEIESSYFPDKFGKKFSEILIDYIYSKSPILLNFIFDCYYGLINIDLVTREQEFPEMDFCENIRFLLLDSSFIVALLCTTDSKYPLSHAIIEQCKTSKLPLYYSPKTRGEILQLISGSKNEMRGLHTVRGPVIKSQFVDDFSKKQIDWSEYIVYLDSWETILQQSWSIVLAPDSITQTELDSDSYEIIKNLLPIADSFRYEERYRREVGYEPRLRSEKQIEHDAYCISLIIKIRQELEKSGELIIGPWFLTYDNLLSFINAANLKKDDQFGYVIQPRILLNYLLIYSSIQFKEIDRESVAAAILRFTAQTKQSRLTIEEYSRLATIKIGLDENHSDIIKQIFLKSPLLEELQRALYFERGGDADTLTYQILSDPNISILIEEIVYSKKAKEKSDEEKVRLIASLKRATSELEKRTAEVEVLKTAIHRPIVISIDIDVAIENKIENIISILETEGAFNEGIIEQPPQHITKENAIKWLSYVRETIQSMQTIKEGIASLLPYINFILTQLG